MMNELRKAIEKATKKKHLDKVLQTALNKYGIWSKEYAEILTLCWDKLETL
jgi:hypothetical protein